MAITRIALVEDDPGAASRFAAVIAACPDLRLLHRMDTVRGALAWLQGNNPDVLLVDLGLPDGSGLEVIRYAAAHCKGCDIMVVSIFGDDMKVLESIVGLLPGGAEMLKQADLGKQEKEFRRMEGMICSMTPEERRKPVILNASRRKRIAKGSGVTVAELNTMLNRFYQMQQMMRKMGKFQKMMARMGGAPPGLLGR